MTVFEPFATQALFFEVISAFGTTGLSMGITPDLSVFGRFILVITMFIGRIGILALLLMFKPKHQKALGKEYPEVDIIVG